VAVMGDYLETLSRNREAGPEHAATTAPARRRKRRQKTLARTLDGTPVVRVKRRRLTKRPQRALLSGSETTTASSGKGKTAPKKLSSETKMAAKKRKKKSGRLTKREIKKAGGIKAAWRARAKRRSGGKKAARKAKRTKSRKRTARRASAKRTVRRAARKRAKRRNHASDWPGESKRHARAARKGHRRRKARKASAAPKRRKSRSRKTAKRVVRRRKRRTEKQRRASKRNIKKAQATMRGRRASQGHRGRSSKRESYAAERRRPRRRSRRSGVMENPMTGVEIFVGSITGLLGFGLADALDRVLATHALTDKGTKDVNGIELYADNPATTGPYAGLFNATAICAPMDVTRWAAGLAMAAVPLTIAHFIGAPTGRAALQFFGFGAGVRIVGKGMTDLVALVTRTTPIGQRLYDGEMRAAALKSGGAANPALASLPSAGLGRPVVKLGAADCAPCADKAGVGYPSMPREVAQPSTMAPHQPQIAPPPPPPPPPAAIPPSNNSVTLRGVPMPRRAPGANWGARDDN
jgi:hypothetical protein